MLKSKQQKNHRLLDTFEEENWFISYLLADGITYRGCFYHDRGGLTAANTTTATTNTDCDDSNQCFQCQTNKCNNKQTRPSSLHINLFADDDAIDRYCYVCDSESEPNCVGSLDDSMLQKCPPATDEQEQDLGCFHSITGRYFPFLIAHCKLIGIFAETKLNYVGL